MADAKQKAVEVTLYYDTISPYSWVAFEVLHRYERLWRIQLTLKPMFLGGVMKASANRPPAMVPAKAAYMGQDLARLSRLYGVPLRQHPDFGSIMFASLGPIRLVTAVEVAARRAAGATERSVRDAVTRVSRAVWTRLWQTEQDIVSEAAHRDVLVEAKIVSAATSPEADALLALAKSDAEVKKLLQTRTDEAVAAGAFGAPWIVVTGAPGFEGTPQSYFGSDRFEVIAHDLGMPWRGPFPDGRPAAAAAGAAGAETAAGAGAVQTKPKPVATPQKPVSKL